MAEETKEKLLEVEEVRQRIEEIRRKVGEMADYIKIDERRTKLAGLEEQQASADFWNNQSKARDVIAATNAERAYVVPYDALVKTVEDAGVMLELAEMEEGPAQQAAFTIGRLALRDAGIKPQVFLMNYRSQTSGMQPDYIVDISAHIEAKRSYCRAHACQNGEGMAKLYADESVAIGAPFGMKYAEEYTVYDPPGKAMEWNRRRQTILDDIGVRLAPGIQVSGK